MNHIKKSLLFLMLLSVFLTACGKRAANENALTDQWGETQSLSVATDWAGIDFEEPPSSLTLESGQAAEMTTYRYADGIVEALYAGDGYELRIRRSNTYQGTELAEDPSLYSKSWETDCSGIPVSCLGDGGSVNLASFDANGNHFTITYNKGMEGNGLSIKDLSALIGSIL